LLAATNVYWQKLVNGVLVAVDMSTNNNNKYSGSTVQTPSLTIIGTVNEDEGNYVCSAFQEQPRHFINDIILFVIKFKFPIIFSELCLTDQ
jgi:hypothetical protein